MITRVDGHADDARLREALHEVELTLLAAPGAVQANHHREATRAVRGFEQHARHARARVGRETELLDEKAIDLGRRLHAGRGWHARPVDKLKKFRTRISHG